MGARYKTDHPASLGVRHFNEISPTDETRQRLTSGVPGVKQILVPGSTVRMP